jgi:hypothetical protein
MGKPDAVLGNVRYKRHFYRNSVLWQGDVDYRLDRYLKAGSGTNEILVTLIGRSLPGRRRYPDIHN